MQLNHSRLLRYGDESYAFLPNYFGEEEVWRMKNEGDQNVRSIVRGKKTGLVLALRWGRLNSPMFNRLTRLSKMVESVEQIVGGQAYVYQVELRPEFIVSHGSRPLTVLTENCL